MASNLLGTLGREVRAGERALQAGGQRGVEVETVVGGADDLVDLREHGHHALRRRRWGGQEAQLAVVLLLVRAVGDQTVQVYIKAEVDRAACLSATVFSARSTTPSSSWGEGLLRQLRDGGPAERLVVDADLYGVP